MLLILHSSFVYFLKKKSQYIKVYRPYNVILTARIQMGKKDGAKGQRMMTRGLAVTERSSLKRLDQVMYFGTTMGKSNSVTAER